MQPTPTVSGGDPDSGSCENPNCTEQIGVLNQQVDFLTGQVNVLTRGLEKLRIRKDTEISRCHYVTGQLEVQLEQLQEQLEVATQQIPQRSRPRQHEAVSPHRPNQEPGSIACELS